MVIGAGLDVPTGVPRALKKLDGPLSWQRDGEGTAFRIASSRTPPGWFSVSMWWSTTGQLPEIPDDPAASGRNTVTLEAPSQGLFALQGSHSDTFGAMIQFDVQAVSYSWAAYTQRAFEAGEARAIETVAIAFE